MSATWKFEIDWEADGTFDHANSDITSYVINASWSYGRDYASQLRGRSLVGSCTMTLFNTTGIFSSFKATSPIYGLLLPGLQVKISATLSGTTYVMFLGYLDSINPLPALGRPNTATLRATGQLGRISGRKLSVSMKTSILTGAAIEEILDKIGFPAASYVGDTGKTTMARWWTGGNVDALNAIRDVEDTESGFIRETKTGKIAFEDRHHRMIAPHTVSQATYSDTALAALSYNNIAQSDPLQQIYNIIEATLRTFTVDSLAVLWTLSENGANSPLIQPGTSRTFWAAAVAVDAWTTPAATTDYLAFENSNGSGENRTANIAITETKFDSSMKIVVTNNGVTPAYLTFLQARGTAILANDPITIRAENLLSEILYGQRNYPLPAKWLSTSIETENYCNFNLGIYAAPIPVLTIATIASRSDDQQLEALTREISDRITIIANGSADLGINEDFFVERISHTLQGGQHMMSLDCSPASVSACWSLGYSKLGQETKLAY